MKKSFGEKALDIINVILLVILCIVTVYPFLNAAALSFNQGMDAARGGIYLWPRVFTFENYKKVFADTAIITAYLITISRTVLGVVTSVLFTGFLGYGLSKKYLVGRRFYTLLCVFPMFFGGGLVPFYMLMKNLHLIDNFLVYILPGMVQLFNMILMKTFFQTLPEELEESAWMDGASRFRTFFSIIIPVSMPIIATICIFVGVSQWNSYFDAYIFMNDEKLYPIQTYLYKLIQKTVVTANVSSAEALARSKEEVSYKTIVSATLIVTTLPVVFIYTLFQKYFTKGVMIGSLKG